MIAKHAIQRRQHRLALRRRSASTEQRHQLPEHRIDAAADQTRNAADGFVYKSSNPLGRLLRRLAKDARRAQDIVMHGLDQTGQTQRGVDRETTGAAQVGSMEVGFFRHH